MFKLVWLAMLPGQLVCPDGKCPIVSRGVEWRTRAEEPGRAYLFVGGRQLGGYDREQDQWRDYDPETGGWSPPRLVCAKQPATIGNVENFGVMRERLTGDDERHFLNGAAVTGRDALAAIGKIEDDSEKLRLTIIGSDAERRTVLNDLETNPALANWRDRLLVQSYPPEHWAVSDVGFARSGKPTIYLQSPDGVVRHRQDEYRGPEKLAEAIRRADPRYRPEDDPDLNRLTLLPRFQFPRVPGWGWAVAGILLLIVISNRRKLP